MSAVAGGFQADNAKRGHRSHCTALPSGGPRHFATIHALLTFAAFSLRERVQLERPTSCMDPEPALIQFPGSRRGQVSARRSLCTTERASPYTSTYTIVCRYKLEMGSSTSQVGSYLRSLGSSSFRNSRRCRSNFQRVFINASRIQHANRSFHGIRILFVKIRYGTCKILIARN